jgi:uncharacterized protein (TIGR02217 family)
MTTYTLRLPDAVRLGMAGGPEFRTEIAVTKAGYENRNASEYPLASYEIEYVQTRAGLDALQAFFRIAHGAAYSFLARDWTDYKVDSATTGVLGAGVGTGLPTYQLGKLYAYGAESVRRDITKPTSSTVAVKRGVSAVAFGSGAGEIAIDYQTGIATFVADATSNASSVTVGATTQVVLAANPGTLTNGEKLYLAGFAGADAALLNGLAHTINSITGAGPYTFTLATNTAGKTITLGSGQGRKYPQASEALTWSGEFDVPVRFTADKFRARVIHHQGTQAYGVEGLGLTEVPE